MTSKTYCQTFDHRSSLGFKLGAGFEGAGRLDGKADVLGWKVGWFEIAGVSGAALFHPPKSSSAAILGGENAAIPNPPFLLLLRPVLCGLPQLESAAAEERAGDFTAVAVLEVPHPKSLARAEEIAGDLVVLVGVAEGTDDSIEAHGSLAAQALLLFVKPANSVFVGGAED